MSPTSELEREIREVRELVQVAWEQRAFLAWTVGSAWLLGSEIRLWLMRRGVIR